MRFVLVGVLAVACNEPRQVLPPVAGGGGISGAGSGGSNTGSTVPDANPDEIQGFVCVLVDPRDFTSCSADSANGITVALPGVGSAMTADDGTFTIEMPTGTNLAWTITGDSVMPSTMGFGASATIFAISVVTFSELVNANGIVFDPTQGTILGEVLQNGSGASLVTVVAAPIGVYPDTFYAVPSDQQDWPGSTTSAFGTFLIAGLTAGLGSAGSAGSDTSTETLTITPSTGSAEILSNVPVTQGSVTFVRAQL
jgi:hypothetical protein